ncbi:MAG TPA: efflux RND transporter permease subunit, partial [Fimbriimonadaceae bacterium]|nr:efflux RND transporter permease subunit [Fimbriimonadaceae bacterium]
MNIGKWSVTRPVAVTMRIAALGLLGFICLLRTPIDLLPKIDIPTVAVTVSWPNTPPETMETQITRPLEQAAASVPGLYMVSSTSSLGSSFVRVQLNYGVDVDQATLDVIQQVQRAVRRFPNDPTITPPSVFKFDPSSLPILSYGVTGDPNLIHLRDLMDNTISPILQSANGVAQVNVSGGYVRAIIVNADPKKLQAYGLSMAAITQRLSQENISLPAGQAIQGNTQYTIRAIGYFTSVKQIQDLPFTVNGNIVTLGQVADVKDSTQDVLYYVRMGGYKQPSEDAVNVSITKQLDANTVDVANAVRDKIDEVQKTYPNLQFRAVYDQSQFVENSIDDLKNTAVFGGILAILIITFFLRNLRSTFVVALSIPISIVSTFALIYFCGFTLNTISLSGLALASGLIVDDAIVVLENIYRHIERDKKRPADAAVSGTQEIIPAVMASTFTVMIVFLPLLLIKGQTGQTFTQFALVVVFAMSISLLDAATVVPMLASRMIHERDVLSESHPEMRKELGIKENAMTRAFDRMSRWFHNLDASYRRGLRWAIYHRMVIMGIALLAILAAGALYPFIGKETLPQTDTGNININVKMPIGTSLPVTDKAVRQIEADLQNNPNVDTYISG